MQWNVFLETVHCFWDFPFFFLSALHTEYFSCFSGVSLKFCGSGWLTCYFEMAFLPAAVSWCWWERSFFFFFFLVDGVKCYSGEGVSLLGEVRCVFSSPHVSLCLPSPRVSSAPPSPRASLFCASLATRLVVWSQTFHSVCLLCNIFILIDKKLRNIFDSLFSSFFSLHFVFRCISAFIKFLSPALICCSAIIWLIISRNWKKA